MRLIQAGTMVGALIAGPLITGLGGCQYLPESLTSAGTATASADTVVAGTRDGQTTLGLGQTLSIALPSNGSTGYAWRLEGFDEGVLARGEPFGAEVTNAHPVGMVGVPGETRWRFRAAARGQTTLVFTYRRPWETGAPPAETARYAVTVR